MRSVERGLRARLLWVRERSKRGMAVPIGLALLLVASTSLAQTGDAPLDEALTSDEILTPVSTGLTEEPPSAADVLVMPRAPTHGSPVWKYSEPDPKLWEWVMLISGEWLKGEITVLREEGLEFDSDKLDELEIDWDDVKELRSPRINTYTFTQRRVAVGRGFISSNQVTVMTGAGMMNFRRDELLSIIPGEQKEINLWSLMLGAGISIRGGNTKQTDILAKGRITRRGAFSRFLVDYRGNFATVDDAETVNNQKADIRLDLFIWDRLFLTPFQIEFFKDLFQNVDIRVSPGAGLGYEIVKRRKLEWNVDLTAMYRLTEFVSVEFPSPTSEQTFALGPGTGFDWDITKRIELEASYSASIAIPDVEDTNQHAEIVLSVELTNVFDLDTTFIWDRTGNPAAEADGSVPLQDDFVLSIGVSIDF
jgi:hypothetical protein